MNILLDQFQCKIIILICLFMGSCTRAALKPQQTLPKLTERAQQRNPEIESPKFSSKNERIAVEKVKLTVLQEIRSHSEQIKEYLKNAAQRREVGQYKSEIQYLKEAIKVYDQNKLPKGLDYIGIHNNIGVAYGKMGKYDKATNKFIEALEIYYQNMGLELHQILTVLQTNLTINSAKIQQRQLSKSMVHIKKTKMTAEKELSMSQLTSRKEKNCSGIFEDVLKLSKELNGENSLITAQIYQNMGNDHMINGKNQLALLGFQKSYEIKKGLYGEMSAELILPKISLAHCNFKLQRFDKGLEQYKSIFILLLTLDASLQKERKRVLDKLQSDLREMAQIRSLPKEVVEGSLRLIHKNNLADKTQWKELAQSIKKRES